MTEIILGLVLAVHLWFVNVSSAAPLFAMIAQWCGAERGPQSGDAATLPCPAWALTWMGIKALLIGTLLGLGLAGGMWVLGERQLFAVLGRFQYKITWGITELFFYWGCLGIYLWLIKQHPGRAGVRKGIVAVLASTNLLYHFPTLFTVMAMLSRQPDLIEGPVGPKEFRQLMFMGHVAPLSVHVALASIAVGSVVTLSILAKHTQSSMEAADLRLARSSAVAGLVATGLQIPVGLWLLTRLDPSAQSQIMGGNLIGSIAFGLSVLLGFRLMSSFGGIIVAPSETQQQARRTQHLLWLIIGLMSITLQSFQ